jgi:pimeloyl-ACP methyl ester carboxylesterase
MVMGYRPVRVTWCLAASALLLPATACTALTSPRASASASYVTVRCPLDVEISVVPQHTCGKVALPAARGPRTRIFVVQVEPPRPTDRAPVLETGTDAGMTPSYGGLAPIAQRTGRRVVIVDLPGAGHSTPSLDCPEVESLTRTSSAASATRDDAVISAIAACRSRVAEHGTDPRMAKPDKLGQALFAVASALKLPRVAVMGHGTTAQAAIALARQHPGIVEAVVLDSPLEGTESAQGVIDAVVQDVATSCRVDPQCLKPYGDPATAWSEAQRRASTQPMTLHANDKTIVLDPEELTRAVRWLVAPVDHGPTRLPALLAEAASGKQGPVLTDYAVARLEAPPLCVGYLPKCQAGVAIGAALSAICATVGPDSDWQNLCHAWRVRRDVDGTPVTGVPALALVGRYNPFITPAAARRELGRQMPKAFVVDDPVDGHNVLGDDCMREIRNGFLEEPTAPPPSPSCLQNTLSWP